MNFLLSQCDDARIGLLMVEVERIELSPSGSRGPRRPPGTTPAVTFFGSTPHPQIGPRQAEPEGGVRLLLRIARTVTPETHPVFSFVISICSELRVRPRSGEVLLAHHL